MNYFISFILLIISIILLWIAEKKREEASQIQVKKNKDREKYLEELQSLTQFAQEEYKKAVADYTAEYEKLAQLKNDFNSLQLDFSKYKHSLQTAKENFFHQIEADYQKKEADYYSACAVQEKEIEEKEKQLEELRQTLAAGIQAQLREKEKIENIEYYKLSLSEDNLFDVQLLDQMKKKLHQPVILSKLIWSTYFLKQTAELCNRLLGPDTVCGIYKITNIVTKQCYIGQSVNIADRWKQHIKRGLGIDAPATNKLYVAMQEHGVWNFSFELIEKCERTELNEKERLWISMYQSDKYGYNSTVGVKK